jgi:SprT-like family
MWGTAVTGFDRVTEIDQATMVPTSGTRQLPTEWQEPGPDPCDPNPTRATYELLNAAYCFFNERLFEGRLPGALVTLQRKAHSYGYFSARRFVGRGENPRVADEIALNPQYIRVSTPRDFLSTLVHEQCHQYEAHFSPHPSKGYHIAYWAALMKLIGLKPTDNGRADGREIGYHMDHIIVEGEPFALLCDEFLAQHGAVPFGDLVVPGNGTDAAGGGKGGKLKLLSKTKFTCPACGFNTWCGDCNGEPMVRES